MKKLHVQIILSMFLIINSMIAVDDKNISYPQPQQMSWIGWFKSFIPGTLEWRLREIDRSNKIDRTRGGVGYFIHEDELRFYTECDELEISLVDVKTNLVKSDIDFNKTVSDWRKKLIEILKAWEKGKNEDDPSVKNIRKNMYKDVVTAIEKIKKETRNLTQEQINFLVVVQESLYNRIVENI